MCGDGVRRNIIFDLLYLTADHQEAQTHFGIKGSAGCNFPCVLCEMPRIQMGSGDLTQHREAKQRSTSEHRELQLEMTDEIQGRVREKERRGREVNRHVVAATVEHNLGKARSRRMGFLAWEGFLGVEEDGDAALFQLSAVDQLHTIEEGLVKHLRTCMLRYLQAKYQTSWNIKAQELDWRIQWCAKQLRWPGWKVRRAGWFFHNEEPYSATELAAIRVACHAFPPLIV
jgi:hypothetical protein